MQEVWKDVVGYEGRYQVSDLGRVKSLARKVWFGNRWCNRKEKILKPQPSGKYRYMVVGLGSGVENHFYIHRLVLEAFIGPCPEGMEACHFPDKDSGNNRLSNLRWDTHQRNMSDREKHGSLDGKMAREWNPLWVKKGKNIRRVAQ
jgi:hypothetical protein